MLDERKGAFQIVRPDPSPGPGYPGPSSDPDPWVGPGSKTSPNRDKNGSFVPICQVKIYPFFTNLALSLVLTTLLHQKR